MEFKKHKSNQAEGLTIVHGILALVLFLVVMQLWLLMATMNAYLAFDNDVVWPAAAASLFCFLLNLGLLRYIFLVEK